ncbi:MAG: thioredoxin-disulfide reductase [Candidatus Brocadiia bacterium]
MMKLFAVSSPSIAAPILRDRKAEFQVFDTIADAKAAAYVSSVCGESAELLLVSDHIALVNPTPADIAHFVFAEKIEGERNNYDVLILGGGPAGLTSAIYTSRGNLSALVIEEMMPGGLMTKTDVIENYPGFPEPVNGLDLSERMEKQARRFGADFHFARVSGAVLSKPVKKVDCDGRAFRGRAVVVAFGTASRHIGIPGEEEFYGRGVSYCATCDGPLYRGEDVVVVGGGDSALQEALYLSKLARTVTIVHRRDALRAEKIMQDHALATPNIKFAWNSLPEAVLGDAAGVTGVRIRNKLTGAVSEIPCKAFFVFIGLDPRTTIPGMESMTKDESGFIITDTHTETNISGVYAIGDLRSGNFRQVATAVGDGTTSSHTVMAYLDRLQLPYFA